MKILSRHIVRAMLGPFFFALSALTGILFLNAVAEEMEDLSGKGLEWQVIAEFMVLTLPHTLALTLPMAVLVAVLHAFSEMTSANEITAMKAGGISPGNILRPLLGAGLLAAATVYLFNDQILPEANHRLSNLLQDINRKSPTLVLKEQAVNRLEAGEDRRVFHLVAREIDNRTSTLRDVRVVDLNDPRRRTITWADSAWIQFSANQADLYMTLYDGVSLQTSDENRAVFDRSEFRSQQLQLVGVGDEFERGQSDLRNERELTVADLRRRARTEDEERAELRADTRQVNLDAVRVALGYEPADSAMASAKARIDNAMRTAMDIFGRTGEDGARLTNYDWTTDEAQRRTSSAEAGDNQRVLNAREYRVEVHKKAALAFACIVFVILGAPLAARFPNGGLGLVIGASTVIFSIYWMGLIGGEKLAEPGYLPPWIAMWGTNVVFLILGAIMYARMGRETSTTRGGALDEILWKLGRLFRSGRARTGEGDA